MKIFVVIPAYNEGEIVAQTVQEVERHCTDIVVVDDGSTDETARRAYKAGATVLRHVINRGQGAALRTGINYALEQDADIIVTYDADGQFEPGEITKMCQPIGMGECDIVLGSRFLSGNKIPFIKNIVLKSAILFTRAITGLNLTDTHNGFRALSRKAATKITLRQDRMAHASEIVHEIARLGLRYKEVPITVKYTEYSRRKGQKLTGAFKILFDLVVK